MRHLWQVPWPPQVESIAMPFHDAASKTVTPGGTRTPRSAGRDLRPVLGQAVDGEREVDPAGAVVGGGLDARPLDEALAGHVGEREVGPVGHVAAHAALRPACFAPVGGDPGHAPLVVAEQQVGGLDRLDDWGVRASMIALVSPAVIAIGRSQAPLSVCRPGMPKETLEAPQVMLTPNSSRMRRITSKVTQARAGVGADGHGQRVDDDVGLRDAVLLRRDLGRSCR